MDRKLVIAALLGAVSASDLCCDACPEGQIKAYSVDVIFDQCGETCMLESDFFEYKFFEWGLKKADTYDQGVCGEIGYSKFQKTETHGVPGLIAITLDMYKRGPTNSNSVCDGLDNDTCDYNPACNYCECLEVPSRCWTMEESAQLPMTIWDCDKPTSSIEQQPELSAEETPVEEEIPAVVEEKTEEVPETPNSVCDGLDEDTCNSNDACNYCTCYAVPSRCWTMEESAMLPMAIWECDKQVSTIEEQPELPAEVIEEPIIEETPEQVNSVCDGLDKETCDANSACNYCTCYAVPSRCWTIEESAMLPMAIWECDKNSQTQ